MNEARNCIKFIPGCYGVKNFLLSHMKGSLLSVTTVISIFTRQEISSAVLASNLHRHGVSSKSHINWMGQQRLPLKWVITFWEGKNIPAAELRYTALLWWIGYDPAQYRTLYLLILLVPGFVTVSLWRCWTLFGKKMLMSKEWIVLEWQHGRNAYRERKRARERESRG